MRAAPDRSSFMMSAMDSAPVESSMRMKAASKKKSMGSKAAP